MNLFFDCYSGHDTPERDKKKKKKKGREKEKKKKEMESKSLLVWDNKSNQQMQYT